MLPPISQQGRKMTRIGLGEQLGSTEMWIGVKIIYMLERVITSESRLNATFVSFGSFGTMSRTN